MIPVVSGGTVVSVYCRVSTEDQNVKQQADYVRNWCERQNLTVKDVVMDEESGRLPLTERKRFADLLERSKTNEVQAIVVYKLDRLTRNWDDVTLIEKYFRDNWNKVKLISTMDNVDFTTANGRFLFRVLMAANCQMPENMLEHREEVILPYDFDFLWLNCGPERTGKSTLAIYTGLKSDPNFSIRNVAPSLQEYFKLLRMASYLGGDLPRGSFVVKDESTDTYAREFYSQGNINANKVFITSGSLNLMHCIIIPKPKSIDQYLREERAEIMTYSYYILEGQPPVIQRKCLAYTKESMNKIYSTPKWEKYFWSHKVLKRKFKPDGDFFIPNLIPLINNMAPGLLASYGEKKKQYIIETLNEATEEKEENHREGKHLRELASLVNKEEFGTITGLKGRAYENYRHDGCDKKAMQYLENLRSAHQCKPHPQ